MNTGSVERREAEKKRKLGYTVLILLFKTILNSTFL